MKTRILVITLIGISFGLKAQNTFPSNANVGIGTNNPQNKVHIVKNQTTGLNNPSDNRILGVFENIGGARILLGTDSNSGSVINFGDTDNWNSGELYYDHSSDQMRFRVNNANRMTILNNGNLLIGKLTQLNNSYKLDVNGSIRANEIKVNTNGADFVFEKSYNLMPLNKLDKFIQENRHLPEIKSALKMQKDGVNLGKLNTKLLQKIEELTLYTIQQEKKIELQTKEIKKLEVLNEKFLKLQKRLEKLEGK